MTVRVKPEDLARKCPTCGSVHPIYHGVKDAGKKGLGWTTSKQVVCPDPFHSKPTEEDRLSAEKFHAKHAHKPRRTSDGMGTGCPICDAEQAAESVEGEAVTTLRQLAATGRVEELLARAEEAEKKHQWAHEQRARAETAREEAERERDDARTQYGNLLRAGEDQDRAFENALAVIERVREEILSKLSDSAGGPGWNPSVKQPFDVTGWLAHTVLSLLNPKESEHGSQDG